MRSQTAREDVREAILDAAERLLERFGYRKTTIDDLAADAGIGKGTIYLHFPSKEEVFLGTVDRIVERLGERLVAIAARPGPPRERLREMLVLRVMFRFDGVQRYPQSLDELLSALRPAFLARRERYFEGEARIFAEVLARRRGAAAAVAAGDLDVARTLLVATNALLPYSLSARELGARDDVSRRVTAISDLLLSGLFGGRAARPATGHPRKGTS
jgi:AcrR family transcriptional regulator